MHEVIRFLHDNPVQYLATIGLDGKPKNRPFMFMLEQGGKLWFCTNSHKDVYAQLQKNPFVEMTVSNVSNAWIRLEGSVVFEDNRDVKDAIVASNTLVKKMYGTADNQVFKVFYLSGARAVIADFSGNPPKKFTL
jgi:uncharacterized pyridoxamine 5'-phosphate oxidase family protein